VVKTTQTGYLTKGHEVFKLKEGTQRTSLRVIFSLNLIVPVDEMGTVEPVGKLTFEINDDEVCVKNCE